MLSLLVLLMLVSVFTTDANTGENVQSIIHKLKSSDMTIRTSGVQIILNDGSLIKDPTIQRTLIKLAESETQDPDWGERDEFPSYQSYYTMLIRSVQKIAVEFRNESAWDQLILSHYNDDTDLAKWLSRQLEAIDRAFYLASEPSDMTRSKAVVILATALANCQTKPKDEACQVVTPKSDQILSILRRNSVGVASPARTESVWGLGLCGGKEEIPFLESLIKPDSNRWFVVNVRRAEKRIRERDNSLSH